MTDKEYRCFRLINKLEGKVITALTKKPNSSKKPVNVQQIMDRITELKKQMPCD